TGHSTGAARTEAEATVGERESAIQSGQRKISRGTDGLQTRRWREPDSNNRFRVARGRFLSGNANCHRGTGATRGDLEPGQLYAGPRFRIPFPSAAGLSGESQA